MLVRRSIEMPVIIKRKKVKAAWKVHERKIATSFGTNRVPMSGAISSLNTHSDTFHSHVYIECKYRTETLKPLYKLYDEVKAVTEKGKFPALIIKRSGSRREILIIHEDHIDKPYPNKFEIMKVERKIISVYSLYLDTQKKAEVENKVPCLSLKQKFKRGCLLGFFVEHKENIQQHYGAKSQLYRT